MRKQPQQHRGKVAVDKIVAAGFLAVRDYGRDGATIPKIAELAGVSPPAVYQYFNNKEDIFREMSKVFARRATTIVDKVEPKVSQLSLEKLVEEMLAETTKFLSQEDGIYLSFLREMQREYGFIMPEIEQRLVAFGLVLFMHKPELAQINNLPVVVFIIANACIASLVSILNMRPNTPVSRLELSDITEGLRAMTAAYIAAESAT